MHNHSPKLQTKFNPQPQSHHHKAPKSQPHHPNPNKTHLLPKVTNLIIIASQPQNQILTLYKESITP